MRASYKSVVDSLRQQFRGLTKNVPARSLRMVMTVVAIGVIGSVLLVVSKAATSTASIEAEAGSGSGNLSVVSDGSASGGSAVRFGGGTGAPAATALPTITDATSANRWAYADVLTASGDTWTVSGATKTCGPSTGMVCAFQWQKSNDNGANWLNITTGDCLVLCQRSYRIQASDIGYKLRVIVTAGTTQGSTDATSGAIGSNATDLTCNYNVSSASALNTNYQSAAAGQVICLAAGTYNWSPTVARTAGANVIVKPAAGAAVTMSFNPNNADFITLAGPMTLTNSVFDGTANNITVYNATLASGANELVFFTDKFNNNNIIIDNVLFADQTGPTGELTHGRVRTDFHATDTQNTIGLTVSNSHFSGGAMIDVLSEGGAGIQILYNEFESVDNGIDQSIHSDSVFDYGDGATSRMVMKHNWFHDMTAVPGCGWTQWDGGTSNVFEDNVISHVGGASGHDGCFESMAVMSDVNSTISHNVLEPGTGFSGALGQVLLGFKSGQNPQGTGTIIRDNTIASIDNGDGGGNSNFFEDHNLCVAGCTGTAGNQGTSAGDIKGSPTWIGGSGPTSFTGFALTAGSLGVGKASDGTSMGLELPIGYAYPR